MKKGSFKWLASLACFTLGAGTLSADDYYITQATEPGSSGICDCTDSGNSCCTFLDGINSANGLGSAATLHITPSTITYTGAATSPCISQGTITIQPATVGIGGTVIDFAGQGSSSCSTSSVFQPTYTDSSDPGIVILDDVVFQNSSGSSIIAIAGGTLQTNGTTNSGSNSFTGNEWDVSVNNAHQPSLIFGVLETGNTYTAPFPGNIVFTVNSTTLALTNNDTGSVTVSGDIEPSGGVTGSQLDVSCPNGGTITLSGAVTVDTLQLSDVGTPSTVALTGTSNNMGLITVGLNETLSLNAAGNIGSTTEIDMDDGSMQFTASFTLGLSSQRIEFNAGTNIFDDQGNNVQIDSLITASGPSHNLEYTKFGSGIQTVTNSNNATDNHGWPLGANEGVFAATVTGAYGGGGIVFEGGTFYVSSDVTIGYSRRLFVGDSGGFLAAKAGHVLLMQHNPEQAGALTIGSSIASLNATGTVLLGNVSATSFTGTVFIGALDDSNNSYPATLSMGLNSFSAHLGKVSGITLQGGGIWDTTSTMSAINLNSVNVPIYVNTGSGFINPSTGTTFTIPGALSTAGGAVGDISLTIGGGGTVVLSGDNSGYTGEFVITDGASLSISNTTNIGSASAIILQGGGALETTATMSVGVPIQVGTGSGFVNPDPSTTLTISGSVSTASGSAKDLALMIGGGGTVVLSGDNSGYNGSFAVTDTAILSISSTANVGANDSPIFFSTPGCVLDKTGSGIASVLAKKAESNSDFMLNISGGTFSTNTDFLEGATVLVADSCALDFNQKFNGTFSGAISGAGNLIKDGKGTLTLTGDLTYTGQTYVNAGKLIVNVNLALSDDPIVSSGGILSGIGTVNDTDVQSGGTLQGGDPLGTLTIVGTLLLESGSTFETTITPTDTSLVTVTGAVTIDPGTIYEFGIGAGSYVAEPRIVLTGSSITGEFADVQAAGGLSHFRMVELEYTGTEVILILESLSIAPLATGGNAIRVADVLDSVISSLDTGIDPVLASLASFNTEAEMTYALNQLHPAQEKGMAISQENNALRIREAVSQRMVDELNIENCFLINRQDAEGKNCCDKNKKRVTAWVNGIGDTLVQDNVTNFWGPLTGYRTNTGGVVMGIDRMFSEHFYAGVIGAYTNSHLHFNANKGTGDISSGYAGVYFSALGSGPVGKMFYANASVIGSWSRYQGDRHIEYPGVSLTAKNHHGGSQVLSHLDTGINLNYLSVTVRPFDSFDYVSQKERGYAEHNAGAWELTLGRKNEIMMRNELGLQFAKCLCMCGSKWIFSPKISWVREVRIKGSTFDTNFTGAGPNFVIHGYFPDRSLIAPGMAISGLLLNDALKVDLYYNGEFKGNYSSNSVGGQVGYSF